MKTAWVERQGRRSSVMILKTPPITVDRHGGHEIHSLTCERDYLNLLWCLKTLFHYSTRAFNVVLHDDGSLSQRALEQLRWHLTGVTIISRYEADARVHDLMARHNASRTFREVCPLARRIFDFPAFASKDRFLILDSDVLFFGKPDTMLGLMDSGRLFFMSDYLDGYVFSRAEVQSRYGIDLIPAFNTGISYHAKAMFDYELIETYCSDLVDHGLLTHPWSEQLLFAMLFSRHQEGADRLPANYGISRARLGPATISHHFVNDGSRGLFYNRGIPYLRRAGFLAAHERR